MNKKIKLILILLRVLLILTISFITILVIPVLLLIHRATESRETRLTGYEEQIQSVIAWETDYNSELEEAIVTEMNMLPENVLSTWLNTDCSITVVDYKDYKIHCNEGNNPHTGAAACNHVKGTNETGVSSSHIYILANKYIVKLSLLHEIGHYVMYETFGNETYCLPNHKTESTTYMIRNGYLNDYYKIPNEYFAEMFSYTVLHNEKAVVLYNDATVMNNIIKTFPGE